MASKRKDPKPPSTWDAVDKLVARHGENVRKVKAVKGEIAESIKDLRVEQKKRTADLLAENEQIEARIKEFALAHPDDLRRRSRKLASGVIQLRLIHEAEPEDGLSEDDIVERLLKLPKVKRAPYISGRLKPRLSALKGAKLKPEQLSALGVRIVDRDSLHIKHTEVDLDTT
jgi:hypothetical protein